MLGPYLDRMSFSGPNVELEPDPIFNLSAALHELAANAAKHGSLSRPKGQLELTWSVGRTNRGMTLDARLGREERPAGAAAAPARLRLAAHRTGHRTAIEWRGASHLQPQRPDGAYDRSADARTLAESAASDAAKLQLALISSRSGVHVFGEPVGRQFVASAALLGLADRATSRPRRIDSRDRDC